MRIVFIDLHCINFLVRPYKQIKDKSRIATYKHKFILDYAFEHNIEVLDYVSQSVSSVGGFKGKALRRLLKKKFYKTEAEYVLENSYDQPLSIKVIFDKEEIRTDDIVVAYLYNPKQLEILKILNGKKVLMGNHFVAINNPIDLSDYGVKAFVNEINLEDNEFVNKYIKSDNLKYITAPYIFAERFKNLHKSRKNKAMAIGTLSNCTGNSGYKLYREFTGTEWIQPLRKMIYDQPDYMPEQLDSYISYIFEDKIVINPSDNFVTKLIKKIKNRRIGWTQKNYMSFDMVEKFNEYSMFLCPEELIGMPGIGFVEGMACGTAYIGLDTPYYAKLGLVKGKHYITYNGTMEDLQRVIMYYQDNIEELNDIAKNGEEFVREHFNKNAVAKYLFDQLSEL